MSAELNYLPPATSSAAARLGAAALTAGFALAALGAAQAQTRPGRTRGTIQEAEVEIVRDRVNTLPEATRNFEKIKLAPPPKPTRAVAYTFPDFRLPATRLAPVTQVLTIAPEELDPLTGNYLKAGGGNYGTFYGRAHLHSTRSEQYSYGLDVRHQSSASGPVGGANSAVAQTSVAATGEYYQGSTAFGLGLDYGRERYHFYGYDGAGLAAPADADAIAQTFSRFAARASARSQAADAPVQYEVGLGYRHWQDSYSASENNFLLDGKLGYALNETSRLTLRADASFLTEKENLVLPAVYVGTGDRSRTFLQATPAYELTTAGGLSLTLGATLGYSSEPRYYLPAAGQDGKPNGVGTGSLNPAVRVAYVVVPQKFQVYAGAGGAIQRVTRYDLSQENPWLGAGVSHAIADTHYGPTGYLGFTAAPAGGLELAARASYGRTRNLYFYNTLPASSRYQLVYDSAAVNVLSVHGELAYAVAGRWRAGLKADYNGYDVHSLAHPYGRPAFVGTAYGTYNVFDKLLLGADFYVYTPNYGTRYTAGYNPGGPFYQPADVQTDAVLDLSLRAEYRITPKFSFFALGNNLASRRYQRFLNYPVKGINVIGGLAYSF